MFLTISSNRQIEALVFKRALKKRLNNPNWIIMDGKNHNMIPRLCRQKNNNNKDNKDKNSKKKTLNIHLNDPCILLIRI